ncbi:hypothetical protein GFC29_3690 [Anoxybacillus sp. B7M1]|jgi:hypothetical protein|nr:hypothetical protein GFC28_1744 [Anoxybacillus sp. B2M1]ANB66098.1 hypothetical protein GFC29_3690 [Anoxybacillus sp. B7M1]KXG10231.1 hypothetical protein AT864_01792 [Anoxybacillus sp. P3H1B]
MLEDSLFQLNMDHRLWKIDLSKHVLLHEGRSIFYYSADDPSLSRPETSADDDCYKIYLWYLLKIIISLMKETGIC